MARTPKMDRELQGWFRLHYNDVKELHRNDKGILDKEAAVQHALEEGDNDDPDAYEEFVKRSPVYVGMDIADKEAQSKRARLNKKFANTPRTLTDEDLSQSSLVRNWTIPTEEFLEGGG